MLLYKNRCFSFSKTLLPSQQILSPFFCSFFLMESLCVCVQEKNTTSLFVSLTQFIACVDITITGLFGNGRLLEECAVYLIRLEEKKICNDSRVVCMCSSTIPSDPSIAEVRNPNGVHLDRCCVSSWPTMAESGAW